MQDLSFQIAKVVSELDANHLQVVKLGYSDDLDKVGRKLVCFSLTIHSRPKHVSCTKELIAP